MRPRSALPLDGLVVAALCLMLVIELTGGLFVRVGDLRLSARSPDRALFVALGLLAVRLLIDRHAGFLGAPRLGWMRVWERVYSSDAVRRQSAPLRIRDVALATAMLCATGALLLREQLRSFYLVPDLGDPLFSMWRMAWVVRQLQGDPRALFDANIFHPEPLTLTFSDAMLLPSLTAAPLLLAGLHPAVVYNVLFLSAVLLSGLATFLLVHKLTGCTRAAVVSGVVYAFYPYRFEHYSHLELQMTHWLPLGMLAVHRFVETLRTRDLLLAAACAVAQLYSSMYYGLFLGLYAAAAGAVLCRARGVGWRRLWRPVAIAGALGVLLSVPLARPYLAAEPRKGDRDVPAVRVYSAIGADYLRAHHRSARYGRILAGGQPERELFPGITPIVLAAAGLVPPIGPATLAYVAGMAVAFDGSLGMNGVMWPYLYDWFLPFRGLRVPARFSVLVGLSLAVLAGFGVRRLLNRVHGWRGHAVLTAVLVLVVVDLQPHLVLQPVWREPPALYAALTESTAPPDTPAPDGAARRRPAVLVELPFPADPEQFALNLPYMYFSIWHGLPLVNGYSGFAPPDYEALAERLAGFPDAESLHLLRRRGATHVTLNCRLHGDGCGAARSALARSPALRHVAGSDWEGQPAVLYEIVVPDGAP